MYYFQSEEQNGKLRFRTGVPSPRATDGCLLGTRPHSRRWAAGKWAKLHLLFSNAPITAWTTPSARPVCGKIVFQETLKPGAEKVRDRCFRKILKIMTREGNWVAEEQEREGNLFFTVCLFLYIKIFAPFFSEEKKKSWWRRFMKK